MQLSSGLETGEGPTDFWFGVVLDATLFLATFVFAYLLQIGRGNVGSPTLHRHRYEGCLEYSAKNQHPKAVEEEDSDLNGLLNADEDDASSKLARIDESGPDVDLPARRRELRALLQRCGGGQVGGSDEHGSCLRAADARTFNAPSPIQRRALAACRSLTVAAVQCGEFQLVPLIFDDMVQCGVDRPTQLYESAISMLAKHQEHRIVLDVFDRLLADRVRPPPELYRRLIDAADGAGEPARAIHFFKELERLGVPSLRAHACLLRVYASRGDWAAALASLRDMRRRASSRRRAERARGHRLARRQRWQQMM